MPGENKLRDRFFLLILVMYTVALGMLFWNRYRPSVILAKCSEEAARSNQVIQRTQIPSELNALKTYDQLVNECIVYYGA